MIVLNDFILNYLKAPEIKSRLKFEVDLIKPGGKKVSFNCNYINSKENQEGEVRGLDVHQGHNVLVRKPQRQVLCCGW